MIIQLDTINSHYWISSLIRSLCDLQVLYLQSRIKEFVDLAGVLVPLVQLKELTS